MTLETCSAAAGDLPGPLARLLEQIAAEQGFGDYKLRAHTLDTEGGNYMGYLYTVDIIQDDRELNLFAKLTNTSDRGAMIDSNTFYRREVFCYTELSAAFDDIQNKHGIAEENRYKFPKYYGSNLTKYEEVVVLENLSRKGFTMYDRLVSMDWEYAKLALEKLATFHALSFALERDRPELFDRLIRSKKETIISGAQENNAAAEGYYRGVAAMVLEAVEPEYAPALQRSMESMLTGYIVQQYAATRHSVLAHGDFRISNLMVKYEEGALAEMLPLDYQMTYHGSPINDLLYLLVTGTDEEFRCRHYEDYVQHYHDALARALARLSHRIDDVYPRSLFYKHLREKLLFGLSIAMFTMPMVLVTPGEQLSVETVVGSEEKPGVAPPSNDIYRERLRGVVRDLTRWGALTL